LWEKIRAALQNIQETTPDDVYGSSALGAGGAFFEKFPTFWTEHLRVSEQSLLKKRVTSGPISLPKSPGKTRHQPRLGGPVMKPRGQTPRRVSRPPGGYETDPDGGLRSELLPKEDHREPMAWRPVGARKYGQRDEPGEHLSEVNCHQVSAIYPVDHARQAPPLMRARAWQSRVLLFREAGEREHQTLHLFGYHDGAPIPYPRHAVSTPFRTLLEKGAQARPLSRGLRRTHDPKVALDELPSSDAPLSEVPEAIDSLARVAGPSAELGPCAG
jgi:hypothetical protein